MQRQINDIQTEAKWARQQQIIFENTMDKRMSAIQETQIIALEKWNRSIAILERVEMLLDGHEEEHVAVDAKIVEFETRIYTLETAR